MIALALWLLLSLVLACVAGRFIGVGMGEPGELLPLTERRDIGARLENWARAYRTTRTIGVSPTGAFCDRLEREANGEKPTGERRKVDEEDAHAIEMAMRHLSRRDRLMLRYCYIDQARPEEVCRKLSIAHRPATVFATVFRQAQGAIETITFSR